MNDYYYRELDTLRQLVKRRGMLLPLPFVALVLGVSRQRVNVLMAGKRLERVNVGVQPFVTEHSLLDYVGEGARQPGRVPGVCGCYVGRKQWVAGREAQELGEGWEMSEAEYEKQLAGLEQDEQGNCVV